MAPDDNGWSEADIASMLSNRDSARENSTVDYSNLPVEQSPGFQPDEGNYVIDLDFYDILGLSSPEDLIKRKDDIGR